MKGITFTSEHESDVIVGFGIACNGRFIMTCSNKTDIIVWDLKGNILQKLDTCLMNNHSAKISSCGRFIVAVGFSPDAKVWEVKFARTGEYQKTVSAFNLSGHTSGIYDIAFDQDTSHIATVSKDGTWKVFHTNIEYHMGQLPRCLMTGNYNQSNIPSQVALSQNADVIAIASGHTIEIFSTANGIRDRIIERIYTGEIVAIAFDPLSKWILTAGDRYVRIFHNVTGYRMANDVARQKLKQTQITTATRERLTKLIEDNEAFLQKFE